MKATINKFFTDIKEFDAEEYDLDIESKPGVFEDNPRGMKGMILSVDSYTKYNIEELIDKVKVGVILIINTSNFTNNERANVHNYLVGALYSLDGQLKVINDNILICTPKGYYYEL